MHRMGVCFWGPELACVNYLVEYITVGGSYFTLIEAHGLRSVMSVYSNSRNLGASIMLRLKKKRKKRCQRFPSQSLSSLRYFKVIELNTSLRYSRPYCHSRVLNSAPVALPIHDLASQWIGYLIAHTFTPISQLPTFGIYTAG